MHKEILLTLALLVVAGCQSYEPAPRVAGLPQEPTSLAYKPLPPGAYAPAPRVVPNNTPYRTYASGQYPAYRYPQSRSYPATPDGAAPHTPPRASGPVAGEAGWAPHVAARQWKWIVIHHSDTPNGSAAVFARYHREVNHWTDLGYHFVIDNGNGAADGLVEVGGRWNKQREGAHAGVLQYNEYGIGICLVGNFDNTRPTSGQMRSLAHLTAYLMHKYHISADHVVGHRDVKKTNCPGRYLDLATVRHQAVAYANSGGPALAAK